MTSIYTVPSVEPIPEDSEDESQVSRREEKDSANEQRQKRTSRGSKTSGRDKERRRRSNKKDKPTQSRKGCEVSKRDSGLNLSRRPRNVPTRKAISSSSSSEEDDPVEDHRAVLAAARARLTSPSMLSTITSQTTATNKSSSSSGSNSTVTQASMSRSSSSVGKRPDNLETPPSPACPDPPNVFAFLEKDQTPGSSDSEEVEVPQWPSTPSAPFPAAPILSPEHTSSSSSSFNGSDNFSVSPIDDDTDRSSSPERSVRGPDEIPIPLSPAEVKFAAHLAAAHQRQDLHGQFGTPNMPRGNTNLPHIPSSALSGRHQYQSKQQVLPRAEKLPVTGYELLATRLASANANGSKIKPMYRKFEALNHRLLLHLQDELSELEEQLHRLDNADTQSRRTNQQIIPASRRAAALAGGELQWHKTDILGKIGYKLNQYNQALSSFHSTKSLSAPAPGDIDNYRSYLHTEHPIAEAETHFLDPADDLVSVYSEMLTPSVSSLDSYGDGSSILSSASLASSRSDPPSPPQNKSPSFTRESHPSSPLHSLSNATSSSLTPLTTAVGIAILLPILTYSTIPNFMGRMVVTALVAAGMIGALIQSGHLGSGVVLEKEGWVVVGGYGTVMAVLAAFVC